MTSGVRSILPGPRIEVRLVQSPLLFPPLTDGRLENKDTLCRNILIYGNCRYEDQGCAFNHDQSKTSSPQAD